MYSVRLNDYGRPPEVLHLMKLPYRRPEPGQVHVPPSAIPASADATFPAAALFGMNTLTARNALDTLRLRPGSTLLVTEAGGAVGTTILTARRRRRGVWQRLEAWAASGRNRTAGEPQEHSDAKGAIVSDIATSTILGAKK
jgi:NADPH:quinone reductase-like Zn-dependent oxidoreductase